MSEFDTDFSEDKLVEIDVLNEFGPDNHTINSWEAMRVKLTCGCWSNWFHVASSMWDFPDEAHRCTTHGERQINLSVQVMLMEGQHRD